MTDCKLPNVVGRMDDVVDAIRDGDAVKAAELLRVESERRTAKVAALKAEYERERERLFDLEDVRSIVSDMAVYSGDVDECVFQCWESYRKQCGWGGHGATDL